VYQRLRAGEGVVRIEERPELGIRRRIAAGIHAGTRPLGTIWVQEGATPLTAQAETALLGASRALAPHLIRYRTQSSPQTRLREDLLLRLLDGRLDAASLAEDIGADPTRPAVVVAFAVRTGIGSRLLHRAELVNLISVHTAAYRRAALVSSAGSRVYALLPDLREEAQEHVVSLAGEIVSAARQHLDLPVQAALGGMAPRLSEAAASRGDADHVLDAMAREHWSGEVASLADLRAQVVLSEVLAFLGERERLRDPGLNTLVAHDAEHGAVLVPSLLAFLDAFGDVRAAADRLHIHPNTLRYRIRRAVEVSGITLDDPAERLLAQLQLRL
jgi:sugar diacid utilization regulator